MQASARKKRQQEFSNLDDHEIRDRLIRTEEEVKYLRLQVDQMQVKLNTLLEIMQQAKGAKWVLLLAASVSGFLAAKGAVLFGWLQGMPR
jgi:hypothetical protein